MEFYTLFHSPIGTLTILSDGIYITGIYFDYSLTNEIRKDDLPTLFLVTEWLRRYFAGERPNPCSLPIRPQGTPFQELVWSLLLQVPHGKQISYGALANQAAKVLGKEKMSAQAVGNAVGRNPMVVVIPCHRVLGANGLLTGFSAGLDRKKYLLDMEHITYTKETSR